MPTRILCEVSFKIITPIIFTSRNPTVRIPYEFLNRTQFSTVLKNTVVVNRHSDDE